jgi:hypothetical protein
MLDPSSSPSATALGDIIFSVRAMRLIWASCRIILAMTSGPREGAKLGSAFSDAPLFSRPVY